MVSGTGLSGTAAARASEPDRTRVVPATARDRNLAVRASEPDRTPVAPATAMGRADPDPQLPVALIVRARQVVVAAGALRTPAVLQRSGIVHPALGRNLWLHPVPVLGARFLAPVDMWRGVMQGARIPWSRGRGSGTRAT